MVPDLWLTLAEKSKASLQTGKQVGWTEPSVGRTRDSGLAGCRDTPPTLCQPPGRRVRTGWLLLQTFLETLPQLSSEVVSKYKSQWSGETPKPSVFQARGPPGSGIYVDLQFLVAFLRRLTHGRCHPLTAEVLFPGSWAEATASLLPQCEDV